MALVPISGPKFTITANNTFVLGEGDETEASSFDVHIVSVSGTGAIAVQARSAAKAAADDAVAFLPTCYHGLNVNNTAATGALVTTAITTHSIIIIPSTGLQVALDVTGMTTGTFNVYAVPRGGNPSI